MLNKVKTGLNLSIIFIFVIAFIYLIIISIIGLFEPEKVKESTSITKNNVEIYLDEDKIVRSYTTFFNIESIVQDIIVELNEGQYEDIYNIFSNEAKINMPYDYYKENVSKYVENNFEYYNDNEMAVVGYFNSKNLKNLYSMGDDEYIALVTSLNDINETKIGIRLIDNSKYVITYLDI